MPLSGIPLSMDNHSKLLLPVRSAHVPAPSHSRSQPICRQEGQGCRQSGFSSAAGKANGARESLCRLLWLQHGTPGHNPCSIAILSNTPAAQFANEQPQASTYMLQSRSQGRHSLRLQRIKSKEGCETLNATIEHKKIWTPPACNSCAPRVQMPFVACRRAGSSHKARQPRGAHSRQTPGLRGPGSCMRQVGTRGWGNGLSEGCSVSCLHSSHMRRRWLLPPLHATADIPSHNPAGVLHPALHLLKKLYTHQMMDSSDRQGRMRLESLRSALFRRAARSAAAAPPPSSSAATAMTRTPDTGGTSCAALGPPTLLQARDECGRWGSSG